MDTTSLGTLRQSSSMTCKANGLSVVIEPSWIVMGEDRLSYTSLIRLIECCREHHWAIDILPITQGNPLDSICRFLTGDFREPIVVGSTIDIRYRVSGVSEKSYSLEFEVRTEPKEALCAIFTLVSVFYDPTAKRSIRPPGGIIEHLKNLSAQSSVPSK